MSLTKEKLEARIKLLEQEREQIKNTMVAYEGAIQEAKHWLTVLQGEQKEWKNARQSNSS